jgi:hypothetical protein
MMASVETLLQRYFSAWNEPDAQARITLLQGRAVQSDRDLAGLTPAAAIQLAAAAKTPPIRRDRSASDRPPDRLIPQHSPRFRARRHRPGPAS